MLPKQERLLIIQKSEEAPVHLRKRVKRPAFPGLAIMHESNFL